MSNDRSGRGVDSVRRALIEACGEPGASVAGVKLANGINANQLRRWMRQRGIEPPELSCLPLRVAASEPIAGFVPVQLSPTLIRPSGWNYAKLQLRSRLSGPRLQP